VKFTLPISEGYVASWGLWEAVREIWQNALDATIADSECNSCMHYDVDRAALAIWTTRGRLPLSSLVLGNSTKREQPGARGKFGEGYKLSLLVLARLGHLVSVYTGDEEWDAKIEFDEDFDSNVLNIYTDKISEGCDGVKFQIYGVTFEQWQDIQANIRPQSETENTILDDPSQAGRVYVGGLYVTTAKGFKCGYAFRAGEISLDRDRGMVSGFDLAWKTSNMWTDKGGKRAVELMKEEAPDVEYVESHAAPTSSISLSALGFFHQEHGYTSVPVSSQEEIEKATAAGIKWVLVPQAFKNVLRLVKSWFIPTTKSPVELLRDFKKKHQWRLTGEMQNDLDEIIFTIEPKSKETK
jgi:hypothetical protein